MTYTVKRTVRGVKTRLDRVLVKVLNFLPLHKDKICPICQHKTYRFVFYGGTPEGCPCCGAFSRERWVSYAFDKGLLPTISSQSRILHVAPGERSLVRRFQKCAHYIPADLHPEVYAIPGIVKADLTVLEGITDLDLIYASHVMEHIPDDRKAMQAMFNALKSGGVGLFLFPLNENGPTEEELGPITPQESEARFGQWDHVRLYGWDVVKRFEDVGFSVKIINPITLEKEIQEKYGFREADHLFVCTKP